MMSGRPQLWLMAFIIIDGSAAIEHGPTMSTHEGSGNTDTEEFDDVMSLLQVSLSHSETTAADDKQSHVTSGKSAGMPQVGMRARATSIVQGDGPTMHGDVVQKSRWKLQNLSLLQKAMLLFAIVGTMLICLLHVDNDGLDLLDPVVKERVLRATESSQNRSITVFQEPIDELQRAPQHLPILYEDITVPAEFRIPLRALQQNEWSVDIAGPNDVAQLRASLLHEAESDWLMEIFVGNELILTVGKDLEFMCSTTDTSIGALELPSGHGVFVFRSVGGHTLLTIGPDKYGNGMELISTPGDQVLAQAMMKEGNNHLADEHLQVTVQSGVDAVFAIACVLATSSMHVQLMG